MRLPSLSKSFKKSETVKKSSVRTREGVCAGARLREGVRRKSEREQREAVEEEKRGSQRRECLSLFFSSRSLPYSLLVLPFSLSFSSACPSVLE